MPPQDRARPAVSGRAAGDAPPAADSERWARVKEIFLAAVDMPDAQRSDYLREQCSGDQELLDEVDSLLRSDAAASSFCETPAAHLLGVSSPEVDAPTPTLPTGTRLGAYEITGFLAEGGMGKVYRARHTVLARDSAIKMVRGTPDNRADSRRLLREARHASRLKHPNICAIHEVGEADGQPFIVMELVEGQSLYEVLRKGPLPIATMLDIGGQIAAALEHAHERGIVHRDLKSSNIMIGPSGNAVVLDFGVARSVAPLDEKSLQETLTPPGMLAGTLTHMAPEVLRGAPADERSDIWSLGIVLYEMASGSLPFTGRTAYETTSAILIGPPAPMPNSVPLAVRLMVSRCLEKDPGRRYQTARALHDAIAAAGRPMRWATLEQLRAVPRERLFAALAAVLLIALGIAAWRGGVGRSRNVRLDPGSVVAVLPFVNASGDSTGNYFADGITEAVIGELGRDVDIRVLSRVSTMRAARTTRSPAAAGTNLGADLVVQGDVGRSGPRVNVAVRVMRPWEGRTLWSHRYDGNASDVLVLQAAVVRGLTEAMHLAPRSGSMERLTAVRAVNPAAYEEYLKGRYAWNQRTSASLAAAIDHFNRAAAIDSTYAPTYAALADCYNQFGTVMVGRGPPTQYRARAEAAAIRALQIDASSAQAHAALGYVRHYQWRWDEAESELKRAIALDPNAPLPHVWYANLLMSRMRMPEALEQVMLARSLDPYSLIVNTNVGWVLDRAGRHSDAVTQLRNTVALDTSYVQARSRLAAALVASGQTSEALKESERVVAMTDSSPPSVSLIAIVEAHAGMSDRARAHVNRLLERRASEYVPAASFALAYAALGEKDHVFEWLERAFEEKSNAIAYLAGEPYPASIKTDPRYAALLKRAGLR